MEGFGTGVTSLVSLNGIGSSPVIGAAARNQTQADSNSPGAPPPISPPSGPTQWLFQGPPAKSKVVAVMIWRARAAMLDMILYDPSK